MRSINSSITGLTKAAETLKAKLEGAGLEVVLDVFKTGPGGTTHFGPSYVVIEVFDDDDLIASTKVHCGGFGEVVAWTTIKKEILEKVAASLLK